MLDRLTEFFFPKQVSTYASDIDSLYFFIFYSSVVLFFIVVFGMVYLSIKYRHRKGEELKLTSSKDHSNLLESMFFIIPLILFGIINFVAFDYPDGGTTLNELVVPSNRPVKLVLSSKDVLHSFFIPVMRSKMDCLPNRYNIMWFDATKEGYTIYFVQNIVERDTLKWEQRS